jgi:EAL domain-containing protein (putative c-di-GMP-specific phosphodiesterase class I)
MFPGNGTDPHVLNTTANLAMHEAKRAGKHQIKFFTNGLADAARERLDLETRLRRAVALTEFELHFQPQFAVGKSHATRFEALVRWSPPGGPTIQPLKFIPLAEQNGLIVPLGTWILEEACRRCAAWQTGSLRGVGVAVNVSALQFACPDFVGTVAATLQSTGLPPHLLELELTESVFIQDVVTSDSTLRKLRQLGVTIALDDFGTGYSSLSYLQNLHIDALKIDRSFLLEAESGNQGAAVMRCVVEMAHALGLRVIGEGVETAAQLELLANLGCDEIQGFLLGRPSCEAIGVAAAGNAPSKQMGNDLQRVYLALAGHADAAVEV